MKNWPIKISAYLLMAIAFSIILPASRELPESMKLIHAVVGFWVLSGGFAIYENVLKKEILEEVKKQSWR